MKYTHEQIQAINSCNNNYSARSRGYYGYGYASSYTPPLLDGKRDIDEEFGYKTQLNFNDYYRLYNRSIGQAAVWCVVKKCWQSKYILKEGEETETPFIKEFEKLRKRIKLDKVFRNLHWKSRVGEYGGLFVVGKETTKTNASDAIRLNGSASIVAVRSHFQIELSDEGVPTIDDIGDDNYGKPEYYHYRESAVTERRDNNIQDFNLHRSRVMTFSESASEGNIRGYSVLEPNFNYVVNLEKITGGTAEGFYKAARATRFYTITEPSLAKSVLDSDEKKQAFEQSEQELDAGFSSSKVLGGMQMQQATTNLTDPDPSFGINLNCLCANLNIPSTEFIGHLTGERASSENAKGWNAYCQGYRDDVLTPEMVMAFIEWIDSINGWDNKPNYDELKVEWPDLNAPSKEERLGNGKVMSSINKESRDAGEEAPFTVEEIREESGFEPEKPETELEMFEEDE